MDRLNRSILVKSSAHKNLSASTFYDLPLIPSFPCVIIFRSLTKISKAQAAIVDSKTGEPVGPLPGLDFLLEWYASHLPGVGAPDDSARYEGGIVHGDFKCDNMVRSCSLLIISVRI